MKRISDSLKKIYKKKIEPFFFNKTLVLLYHRVFDPESDPQLLCASTKNFRDHMMVIKKYCNPISLSKLTDHLLRRETPREGVVVTFDDGYADNYLNARPVLEEFEIPATIFVTTGYIDSTEEFWWDKLERLVLMSVDFPEHIHLSVNGENRDWDLEKGYTSDPGADKVRAGWNVTVSSYPTARHKAYSDIHRLLRTADVATRKRVMEDLERQMGSLPAARFTHRPPSGDEIRELAESNFIDIGAHTVSHPVLAAQSSQDQKWEIEESKKTLETIIKGSVENFSYPYGGQDDFNEDTVEIVKKAGFKAACANIHGIIKGRNGDNIFRIPRVIVRDWDAETFKHKITGFLRD